MKEIKPIETVYKGCRFRSRLEARWAVFFDALGVEWEYEPEGFELPSGRRYLPDFRVRCYGRREYEDCVPFSLYIEVKGQMSPYDYERIVEFVQTNVDEGEVFENPVLIVSNVPESINSFYMGDWYGGDFLSFEYIDGDLYQAIPTASTNGEFYLMGPDYITSEGVRILNRALTAARSARFEWGENGAST